MNITDIFARTDGKELIVEFKHDGVWYEAFRDCALPPDAYKAPIISHAIGEFGLRYRVENKHLSRLNNEDPGVIKND